MPALRDIQTAFAGALLNDGGGDPGAWLREDGIAADTRIDIYRNNVRASLGDALGEMFPVVRRLVGDGFFAYAADQFVSRHPPVSPCVADYGAGFAGFLSGFAPCGDLPYLPDVARFERLLHAAARCADAAPLTASALATIDAADAGRLAFDVQRSRDYLCSPWPVTAIWRANQEGCDCAVGPHDGGVWAEVCRPDDIVEFRELAPADFAFRAALAGGATFADALVAASDRDTSFDAAAALAEFFADRAVTGVRLME